MKYIIGNWKMNKNAHEAIDFANQMNAFIDEYVDCSRFSIAIAPPSVYLENLYDLSPKFQLVSQNIAFKDYGALTGEISVLMLKKYIQYVLVGHSERRQFFNEDDNVILKKITLTFNSNLTPIFCFGEPRNERESGTYLDYINKQLLHTILNVSTQNLSQIILAYEPIWAIGTGHTPNTEEIQEVHEYVRSILAQKVGLLNAKKIPILYGGSCNSENAESIFFTKNVDGLLLGGASLEFEHFKKIIQIAQML